MKRAMKRLSAAPLVAVDSVQHEPVGPWPGLATFDRNLSRDSSAPASPPAFVRRVRRRGGPGVRYRCPCGQSRSRVCVAWLPGRGAGAATGFLATGTLALSPVVTDHDHCGGPLGGCLATLCLVEL